MQPRHLMPKGQAQVTSVGHVPQGQDEMCCSAAFVFGVRDGKILSPCKRKSRVGAFERCSVLHEQVY